MLLCANSTLNKKTVHLSAACYVHVPLYNVVKQMFTYQRFVEFVIKQRWVKILILVFIYCFVTLFNKNAFLSKDFP